MDSAMTFTLGTTTVSMIPEYTITTFADGLSLWAAHEDVSGLGQSATAQYLGYSSVSAMNKAHDPTHGLLADWLGWGYSRTLYGVACGTPYVHTDLEEDAVKAIQRLAQAAGIDLVGLAQKVSERYE